MSEKSEVYGQQLYRADEAEWWYGRSLGAVLKAKQEEQGLDDYELIDEHYLPRQVTEEEMESLMFQRDQHTDGDEEKVTFAEQWDRMVREGRIRADSVPGMFASTEF